MTKSKNVPGQSPRPSGERVRVRGGKQTSKVRFVYARCDADASYLAYKGLTCRFLASGNIAYQH
ncbi:hypothetical protein AWP60_10890 [Escherichia coli]|nr:hypothetical protein AWP60_10890 [Escherichia coli]